MTEQNDEWLVQRRYVSEHSVRLILFEAAQVELHIQSREGDGRAQFRLSRERTLDDQDELHRDLLLQWPPVDHAVRPSHGWATPGSARPAEVSRWTPWVGSRTHATTERWRCATTTT